ncbi:C40 family peptidase [Mobiluncus holmesii]|uniref:C40 family peptidase n=1 Tax=Mobiluncus holmesii TaxID=144178 RepID=UPI0002F02BF2|nr:C40 family peptidase [Mobiluncus holmesii]STY89402.1 Probable endopeptidase cgR_2070 precursor [Mobiluncus holmesii]
MANTTSRARHRAATKPVTPLDSLKTIDAKKGFVAAASAGLALGTVWAGSAIAAPEGTDAPSQVKVPVSAQVGDAVAQAHLAVAANPVVTAPENVAWTEGQVEVPAQQQQEQAQSTNNQGTAARSTHRAAVSAAPISIPANIAGGSIADIALRYQGVPYVYGGTTPNGFDCSGFVGYVYNQAGIALPRTSWAQGASGKHVSAGEAQAGDIVYYGGHVGVYLGEGKMVHSPRPGESVRVQQVYGNPEYVRIGQ